MTEFNRRSSRLAAILIALTLLLLFAATAFAIGGDYGVNTGASASSSSCGGRGQPPCSITYGGYTATFRTVSGGYAVYSFSFSCELLVDSSGNKTVTGSECSQYLSSSS